MGHIFSANDRVKYDLIHRSFGPDQPEKPFFQRSQVQHQSVHSVCQNCDKETSNSIEEVVIRGSHDDKQDEEGIQEGDGTDRSMGRIEEEGKAYDKAIAEMEGREGSQLVLELVGSPNTSCLARVQSINVTELFIGHETGRHTRPAGEDNECKTVAKH